MHSALDSENDEFVHRNLEQAAIGSSIFSDEILRLINAGKIEELKQKAEKSLRRRALFFDWCDLGMEDYRKDYLKENYFGLDES